MQHACSIITRCLSLPKRNDKSVWKMHFSAPSQWHKIRFEYQRIIFNEKKAQNFDDFPKVTELIFNLFRVESFIPWIKETIRDWVTFAGKEILYTMKKIDFFLERIYPDILIGFEQKALTRVINFVNLKYIFEWVNDVPPWRRKQVLAAWLLSSPQPQDGCFTGFPSPFTTCHM